MCAKKAYTRLVGDTQLSSLSMKKFQWTNVCMLVPHPFANNLVLWSYQRVSLRVSTVLRLFVSSMTIQGNLYDTGLNEAGSSFTSSATSFKGHLMQVPCQVLLTLGNIAKHVLGLKSVWYLICKSVFYMMMDRKINTLHCKFVVNIVINMHLQVIT